MKKQVYQAQECNKDQYWIEGGHDLKVSGVWYQVSGVLGFGRELAALGIRCRVRFGLLF